MSKIGVVDLFAGCGGLTEGFEQHGQYKTIAAVEWEKYPCMTLSQRLFSRWKYKNAEEIVLKFDMQRLDQLFHGWNDSKYGKNDGLLDLVKKSGSVDLVIGGPPCQAYSVAGRIRDKNGMHNDYRNYLFESYLEVIKKLEFPKVFVFENVPGILSAEPGGIKIIDRIRSAFNELGYLIVDDLKNDALFNMADYGIPQNRKRIIIIGISKKSYGEKAISILDSIYKSLHAEKNKCKQVNVGDAFYGLDKFYPLSEGKNNNCNNFSHEPVSGKFLNNIPRYHNKRDIEIFRMLAEDISSGVFQYTSTSAIKQLYTEKTGKKSSVHKYNVLRNNNVSNTIPAHLYKDGLRHIHPDPKQARSITVREAARLQGFDDDYEFVGPMGSQYKMIGNAVPPPFSKLIAEKITEVCFQ